MRENKENKNLKEIDNLPSADKASVDSAKIEKDEEQDALNNVGETTEKDIELVNISKPISDKNKINRFDTFWLKVWAFICGVVTAISNALNKLIKLIFRKKAPDKYVKATVATILIIICMAILAAPFNITINEVKTLEIYSNNLVAVETNIGLDEKTNLPIYKWGYADKNGKIKITCAYDEAMSFKYGVAWVRKVEVTADGVKKNYWMLINTRGKRVGSFSVAQNSEMVTAVGNFSDKVPLAKVYLGGKYGFVDTKGRIKISNDYDDAGNFEDVIARVSRGNEQFFIDKKGKLVGGKYENVRDVRDGMAAVKREGKWGFINVKGKEVVEAQYDEVSDFKMGYALIKNGSAYGVIDANGSPAIKNGLFTDLEIKEFFSK